MGIVTLLAGLFLDHWPLFTNWLKEHYILLRSYHGIGFDGTNATKLLGKVDILENDVLASQTYLIPIVHCFRKFSNVKECTFRQELGSNVSSVIKEFQIGFFDLQPVCKSTFKCRAECYMENAYSCLPYSPIFKIQFLFSRIICRTDWRSCSLCL